MNRLRVELHNFDQPMRDITDYVVSASWASSVDVGGERATIELAIPFRHRRSVLPEGTGYYVVMRDAQTKVAHWWGRCAGVSTGLVVEQASESPSHIRTQHTILECVSWIHALQQSRVLLAPGIRTNLDGFVYQFDSWAPVLTELMQALSYSHPGQLLQRVWHALVRLLLPETLNGAGSHAGQLVPVVWDESSALMSAPDRARSVLSVPGFAMNAFGQRLPAGTIWSILEASFGCDPNLTEMVPILEPGVGTTPLGTALGAQPSILYRLKPYNVGPVVGKYSVKTGLFQTGTVDVQRTFRASDIVRFSLGWRDEERRNGAYARTFLQPGSQMGAYGLLGSPLIDETDAQRHGLRFYEADWPLFPASAEDGVQTSPITDRINAIIEWAATCVEGGHLYASGSIDAAYNPSVRAGMWYALDLDDRFTLYATGVQQNVRVNPDGVETFRTSIQFVRGSYERPNGTIPAPSIATAPGDLELPIVAGRTA